MSRDHVKNVPIADVLDDPSRRDYKAAPYISATQPGGGSESYGRMRLWTHPAGTSPGATAVVELERGNRRLESCLG